MPYKPLLCNHQGDCMPCATGIILWEVCSQEPLKYGGRRALHGPQDCPESIADLQKACCAQSIASRPSMREVCCILSSSSGGKRALEASPSRQTNMSEPSASGKKSSAQESGSNTSTASANAEFRQGPKPPVQISASMQPRTLDTASSVSDYGPSGHGMEETDRPPNEGAAMVASTCNAALA